VFTCPADRDTQIEKFLARANTCHVNKSLTSNVDHMRDAELLSHRLPVPFCTVKVTIQVLGVSFVTVGAAGSTLGTCLLRR